MNVRGAEVDLKGAHAVEGTFRGTDFRRIVGEGGDFVSEDAGCFRELISDQLHAIARVARKPYGDILEMFYNLAHFD